MNKVTLKDRVDKLEIKIDNKADEEHIHSGMVTALIILGFTLLLFIIFIFTTTTTSTPPNYYYSSNSFCQHYNMTYRFIVTPIGQQNINECYSISDDTITKEMPITQIGNRWVFK